MNLYLDYLKESFRCAYRGFNVPGAQELGPYLHQLMPKTIAQFGGRKNK